jgi:hypothetical protein
MAPPDDESAPDTTDRITDYRHTNRTKKNLPLAGQPVRSKIKEQRKHRYAYDPHLPPVLRFDTSAAASNADRLPELLDVPRVQRAADARAAVGILDAAAITLGRSLGSGVGIPRSGPDCCSFARLSTGPAGHQEHDPRCRHVSLPMSRHHRRVLS